MQKNLKVSQSQSHTMKALRIETISQSSEKQDEQTEVRSLLEYLFLDVKVRSPSEVSPFCPNQLYRCTDLRAD